MRSELTCVPFVLHKLLADLHQIALKQTDKTKTIEPAESIIDLEIKPVPLWDIFNGSLVPLNATFRNI